MNDQEMQALLGQLESVHLPDVSRVPAPGWWVLLLLMVLLVLVARYLLKRHRASLWKREARAELGRLRDQLETQSVPQTLSATSKLARQVVLLVKGREQVAHLHGQAWLDVLDDICGRPLFAQGFGRLLEQSPYQRAPSVESNDLHSLLDAVEELISAAARQPHPLRHVE